MLTFVLSNLFNIELIVSKLAVDQCDIAEFVKLKKIINIGHHQLLFNELQVTC